MKKKCMSDVKAVCKLVKNCVQARVQVDNHCCSQCRKERGSCPGLCLKGGGGGRQCLIPEKITDFMSILEYKMRENK